MAVLAQVTGLSAIPLRSTRRNHAARPAGTVGSALVRLLRERHVDVRPASGADAPGTVRCDLTDPATFPAALEGPPALSRAGRATTGPTSQGPPTAPRDRIDITIPS
jgi:hypothetical protein